MPLEEKKFFRTQENDVNELLDLVHRYSPVAGVVMDLCCGTAVSAMATLPLGRIGIMHDIDDDCLAAGVPRAQWFYKYLSKLNKLPDLTTDHIQIAPADKDDTDTRWNSV